jgi:predicted NBD/HSP70 family sugar kinase
MPTDKPSLDLVRSLTDEHVLRLLMEEGPLTRAEIALRSGISKTTISESMRRVEALGLVTDTGERTTGRGRSGSYYALTENCGSALVATIRPQGVAAEAVDAAGMTSALVEIPLDRAAGKEAASSALLEAATAVRDRARGVLRLAVVSAADPVDRRSGRLVQLPDAPFLVGDLDPVGILQPLVQGDVAVDNDINWAAKAEGQDGRAAGVSDFVYIHLGEGLGSAVVSDGEIRRGGQGLAGEIAHLMTRGVEDRAVPFTEVFAQLGLRKDDSTAIDVETVIATFASDDDDSGTTRTVLARAVAGVIAAAVALIDPELVIIGGDWGRLPAMTSSIADQFDATSPRRVRIESAVLVDLPEHAGARHRAIDTLRTVIVGSVRPEAPPSLSV